MQQSIIQATSDTSRILLENELAKELAKTNKDSAFHILQTAITKAGKINYQKGLFEGWFSSGVIHLGYNQLDSAFIEFSKSKEIAAAAGDKKGMIRALNALSYSVQNKRLGIPHLNEALEIAIASGDKKEQGRVLTSLGIVYSNLGEFDKAEDYYLQTLPIIEALGEKKWLADNYRNLGNNAGRANHPDKAIDYFEQGVLIMQQLGLKSEEASLYNMMSYTFIIMGDYPKALENSQIALKLMEADGNNSGIAFTCNQISDIYLSLEDFQQALFYIEKSYKLWEEVGENSQQSDLLYRKGYLYKLKADYPTALRYLQESYTLKKAIGQAIGAQHFYDLGFCYDILENRDSALYFFQIALESARETNNVHDKAMSLTGLAKIHFQQGNTGAAIAELKEASDLATVSGNKEQRMEASKLLYQIYKSQNDSGKALYYHEIYQNLQDSLFSEKNIRQLGRLEANYEFEKEKQQLAFEQEKELEQQRLMRRLYLIALGVMVLFIVVIYRYYRSKQRANAKLTRLNEEILSQKSVVEQQKEKLEELDEAKSRFFTNISHEFRTPLTIISGMTDQIRDQPALWLDRGTKIVKQNTQGLLNLVNQILELRKLEANELKVEWVHGNVVTYLRYIVESHQSFAAGKGLQLQLEVKKEVINMDYDPDKLLRIVSN
ncbi:MAG: tetratricopeptide repeat protein, partial [Saprospiraceae bacterium]|nr:tetratricopeptide repeat protein [Saprospiraceae bacterium]